MGFVEDNFLRLFCWIGLLFIAFNEVTTKRNLIPIIELSWVGWLVEKLTRRHCVKAKNQQILRNYIIN